MDETQYSSFKAYGLKSALSFEKDKGKDGDHRVSVQGAPAIAERTYDWKKKIVVQLNDRECRMMLLVLIGVLPKFEAAQHGTAKDKTFSIEVQASGKFFAKVAQTKSADGKTGGMFAVPIEWVDGSYVEGLILGQLQKNAPWMSCAEIRQSVIDVFNTCDTAKKAAQAIPAKS